MGIDAYMRWKGQTEAERQAQYTGMSVVHGHVGYLREAYHGGPYVTSFLVGEGFDSDAEDGAPIPAATLRERLPAAVFLSLYRQQAVYNEGRSARFIKGEPALKEALAKVFGEEIPRAHGGDARDIAAGLSAEQLRATKALIDAGKLPQVAQAFVDFVLLAERKERETGEPVSVFVSA